MRHGVAWALWDLVLRTPRLTLRPDDDEGLLELVALALRGVHPPEEMPFGYPWTDQAPDELVRSALQHHWQVRSRLTRSDWRLNFLVRHQGQGFGTEMRAAVLLLAFDHLGAVTARSGAFSDNPASLRVSEQLGYRRDGSLAHVRRGARTCEIRLVVEASDLVRPELTLQVLGLDGCRELLGAV